MQAAVAYTHKRATLVAFVNVAAWISVDYCCASAAL